MSTQGLGEDDAVSPIIGTVLMVAVTVILAAVVTGAFLGFKPIPKESQSAAVEVKFDPNANQVWVTYVDKANSDYINVTFRRAAGGVAKTSIVAVGTKAIVEADEGDILLQGGPGNIVYNFTSTCGCAPVEGDRIDVVVSAVQGSQGTVIYTESGTL